MKKNIKITTSDLHRIIKNVLNEQAVANDKADLVDVLIRKINNAKNDPEWDALGIAKMVYNNCAHFMNKTDIFSNRQGEPLNVPLSPQ
jgi:hypothetical protein